MIRKKIRPKKYRSLEDFNSKDIIVIDQRPANSELLNDAGWPSNEISLLLKLNANGEINSPLAQSLMDGLNSLPTPQIDNTGKSDSEILAAVIPAHIGTLGEYLRYLDSLPLSPTEREFMEKSAKEHFSGESDEIESVEPEKVD